MAEQSNNAQSFGGIGESLQTAGESDDMQRFGGFEGTTGAMEGSESLVPNRQGSETGFLDQTLPIPKEYLKYLTKK